MKTKILITALLSISTFSVFADNCSVEGHNSGNSYFGQITCTKVTLPSLLARGELTVLKTTVNGETDVIGEVTGAYLTINGTLSTHGEVNVNHLTVTGSTDVHGQLGVSSGTLHATTVYGALNATNTTFDDVKVFGRASIQDSKINGNLTLSSKWSVLNGTFVNNILVTKSIFAPTQIVCLEKASHVTGNITFDSGKGTLYIIGASKIDGKVIGANVIKGACPRKDPFTIQN
ncbi:MAG: hypothetical protein EXR81_04670 [Gammaproteobacteria bacterium]|nr:hypothetical protein [Gammaproteobacteria bacterium]